MDCIKCPIAEVCTIKRSLKKAAFFGDLSFTNCKIKKDILDDSKVLYSDNEKHGIVLNKEEPMSVENLRPARVRNFNKESNAIRMKQTEYQEKVSSINVLPDSVTIDNDGFVNCPTCGGRTTQDDLKMCTDCSEKIVCSNCGTENGEGIQCPDCWNK